MIPDNVRNYYSSQWWIFTHFGIPLVAVILIAHLIARILEWRDDMKDDNGKPSFENDLSVIPKKNK